MKAVCLLLCLAVARQCAGSIFQRRHYPEMDSYVAQSQDYIDPYLRNEQYQQALYQQQYQPQYVQRHHQRQGRNQQRDQQRDSNEEQNKHSHARYLNQEDYQQKRQESRQEMPAIYRNADSSIENVAQETIPVQNALTGIQYDKQYAAPRYADVDMPVAARRLAAIDEISPAYGDATAWRGLEIASSPSAPVDQKDIEKIFRDAQKAMKHIKPESMSKFHQAVEVAAQTSSEDDHLNATELLKKYQYPVEEHTIKTEDGYYLKLFRISSTQQTNDEKPREVVFLMHGLLGSADDWLLMGPGKSLAYLLADAGYDVWLGNARGNKYSHHASKHRAQPDFWQFSNDEIALFDLPAMIDYVLEMTKQQKMYYVGHSQGTTAFFALAAARPEYNDKIKTMYALSPMVYMSGVRSPLVRMIAPGSQFYERLTSQLGNGEFKPSKELVRTIGGDMCEKEIGCKHVCSNVYFVVSGVNVQNLEPKQIATIMNHLPAGSSTKQMKHYGQSASSLEFRMFDYGSEMNEKVYGQREPPKYDVEKVTTPTVLYYSEHDWLAHPKDVLKLQKKLPNATARKIPQDYFSHMDFQYSKQAPEVVYKNLISSIQEQKDNKPQQRQEQQQTSY